LTIDEAGARFVDCATCRWLRNSWEGRRIVLWQLALRSRVAPGWPTTRELRTQKLPTLIRLVLRVWPRS